MMIQKLRGKNKEGFEGFTIIELLVVIAIIGILAAIGFLGYPYYVKVTRIGVVVSDIRNVYTAAETHFFDNDTELNMTIPDDFRPLKYSPSRHVTLTVEGSETSNLLITGKHKLYPDVTCRYPGVKEKIECM